jgi:hypothetical protein
MLCPRIIPEGEVNVVTNLLVGEVAGLDHV